MTLDVSHNMGYYEKVFTAWLVKILSFVNLNHTIILISHLTILKQATISITSSGMQIYFNGLLKNYSCMLWFGILRAPHVVQSIVENILRYLSNQRMYSTKKYKLNTE